MHACRTLALNQVFTKIDLKLRIFCVFLFCESLWLAAYYKGEIQIPESEDERKKHAIPWIERMTNELKSVADVVHFQGDHIKMLMKDCDGPDMDVDDIFIVS